MKQDVTKMGTENTSKPSKKNKIIYYFLMFFGLGALILLLTQSFFFGKKVYGNWQEIKFAYEKAPLVRSVRLDYEKRMKEVENDISRRADTEQLIQEAAAKLQQEGLK